MQQVQMPCRSDPESEAFKNQDLWVEIAHQVNKTKENIIPTPFKYE